MTTNTIAFNHLALSVKDVNESAEFYMTVLGLKEITNKTGRDTIRWFSLGEDKELHLIAFPDAEIKINKAVHFAVTASHFNAFIKKLDAIKLVYSDWPGTPNNINVRPDGVKQVFFQDPNGYWIEVNNVGQKHEAIQHEK